RPPTQYGSPGGEARGPPRTCRRPCAAPRPPPAPRTPPPSAPDQALDRAVQLTDLRGPVAGADRLGHAVLGVVGEEEKRDALEPCFHGADLGQDIDAVAVSLDHLLQTANLPLDAATAR